MSFQSYSNGEMPNGMSSESAVLEAGGVQVTVDADSTFINARSAASAVAEQERVVVECRQISALFDDIVAGEALALIAGPGERHRMGANRRAAVVANPSGACVPHVATTQGGFDPAALSPRDREYYYRALYLKNVVPFGFALTNAKAGASFVSMLSGLTKTGQMGEDFTTTGDVLYTSLPDKNNDRENTSTQPHAPIGKKNIILRKDTGRGLANDVITQLRIGYHVRAAEPIDEDLYENSPDNGLQQFALDFWDFMTAMANGASVAAQVRTGEDCANVTREDVHAVMFDEVNDPGSGSTLLRAFTSELFDFARERNEKRACMVVQGCSRQGQQTVFAGRQ